nr:hypothetical protein [Tanacetum cinerariifolium]
MRISSMDAITNLSKYGLHTRFMRSMNTAGARATGAALGIKSIWNSTWRTGGRPGRSSRKTSENSLTTGQNQSKNEQNQEQTRSAEEARIKPDKVKA